METNFNIEEIEQYLDGTLKEADLKVFQQRLENNKELAARVELMKQVDLSIRDEKAVAVQKTVLDLGNEFFKKETKKENLRLLPFYRRPLAIAASFLLVLTFGFLIWWQMGSGVVSNQELYATYYIPYQANDTNRGEGLNEDIYNQAIQQYKSKNYTAAINYFQEFLSENPSDNQALYSLAHAYLNNTPPALDQAGIYFQQVIKDGKSIQVSKAKWYLALIYLKQNETIKAKNLLTDLVHSEDDKLAEQARSLLKKVNN